MTREELILQIDNNILPPIMNVVSLAETINDIVELYGTDKDGKVLSRINDIAFIMQDVLKGIQKDTEEVRDNIPSN